MVSLDDNFKKEFNKTRATIPQNNNIYDLKLPEGVIPKKAFYVVSGIEDEVFKDLNDYQVELVDRGVKLEQRLVNSKGQTIKTKNGKVLKKEIPLPKDSQAVISIKELKVPFKYNKDGFGFVDYIIKDKRRMFVYIVPKANLYKVNYSALAISSRTMKGFYGIKIKSWNWGVLNLCIIPYKPNVNYTNTIILKVKSTLDYREEIKSLFLELIKRGVVSDPYAYLTSEGENIAISSIPNSYDAFSFEPRSQSSIADLKDISLEDVVGA